MMSLTQFVFAAVFAVQDFFMGNCPPQHPRPLLKKNWSVLKFNPVRNLVVEISNELRFALESYKRLDKETNREYNSSEFWNTYF